MRKFPSRLFFREVEMQAKKLLSCGFAFLFVLAFAGVSLAQQNVPQSAGTWVEIEYPEEGKFAAIGDTVVVVVRTVSEATGLTVQIKAPSDEEGEEPENIGSPIERTGVNTIAEDDENITDGTFAKINQSPQNHTEIKFYFPVTTTGSGDVAPFGGETDGVQLLGLYAEVTIEGEQIAGTITNLDDDKQILPGTIGFPATPVGDGVTFGIDNRRPAHGTGETAAFKEIKLVLDGDALDGAEASADLATLTIPNTTIKQGDNVKVTLRLRTSQLIISRPEKATVYFVKESLVLHDIDDAGVMDLESTPAERLVTTFDPAIRDSAITSVEFPQLYVSDELTLPLDTGDDEWFGDGTRVRVFAFLEDNAGNLGAATAAAAAPSGDPGEYEYDPSPNADGTPDNSGDEEDRVNLFLIDTTLPKVTLLYPVVNEAGDSLHVSASTTQPDLEYRSDGDGSLRSVDNSDVLKPLTVELSEDVAKITVKHGGASVELDGRKKGEHKLAVEGLQGADDELVDYSDKPGGVEGKLLVEVEDLIGNKSEPEELEDIVYDPNQPEITNLFPSETTAPKDGDTATITKKTYQPIFTNSEELDSLVVQYVQDGDSSPHQASKIFSGAKDKETLKAGRVEATIPDTLLHGLDYYLQLIAFDKAGNSSAIVTEPLAFDPVFPNPTADSFMVVTEEDDVEAIVAGEALVLNLTALDTQMTRAAGTNVPAVVYGLEDEVSRLRLHVSPVQEIRLKGISFEGDDIRIAVDDTGRGRATLVGEGWKVGERSVTIKSELTLTDVTVFVENLDDADVTFSTRLGPFNFHSAAYSQFDISAVDDDDDDPNTVTGEFQILVKATDEFGNKSMKKGNTIDSDEEDEVYKTIAVEFSSTNSQVRPPRGMQEIVAGLNTFPGFAPATGSGRDIVIRVFSDDPVMDAAGTTDTLSFGPPTPPPAPGAPAAPDSVLIVEDYMGPRGDGDQGGMVLVSFNNSPDHASVDVYKLFRHLMVSTGLDEDGKLMLLEEPKLAWVPWADLSPDRTIVAEIQRAVVPALDNVPTNWAVAAVGAAGSSVRTSALGKRTFTKESVQQTLELLGMAPEAVLTIDELMNQFNAPEDYIQSIIGDQKDLVFLPVNPDVSVLMGDASVPANIRTSAHGQLMSALTTTKAPVRAVDNIAPAEVTESAGMPVVVSADGNAALRTSLTWKGSVDEGIVGFIPYRGHSIPIMGVKDYKVMRGASAEELEELTTLKPGSAQFVDKNLPEVVGALVYRIDAFDGENTSPGQIVAVNLAKRLPFTNAEGEPVYLIRLPFQGGNLTVDFEDFVAFAAAFNSQRGQSNFNPQADVDNDGVIDFADFVIAAMSYGRTAVLAAGSKIAIAPQRPGVNPDTELNMELTSDRVLVGEEISVTVSLANAEQLMGFGFELTYDADKFEFVSAVPADNDLLKSQGGDTPLFKNWPEDGRVAVVNAIVDAGSVSGEGALVTFTFKVLREFADNARFEIAQGVVFDPSQLSNPVVSLGALDVQSTPSEFALHQNFPNPFNPQTNIPYDLAESGDVVLRIYNLLGQEVRTLVSERQPAGRYKVQWAGMDDRGVSVSSGIYFYQVSVAGKFQDAKRLMLLK